VNQGTWATPVEVDMKLADDQVLGMPLASVDEILLGMMHSPAKPEMEP